MATPATATPPIGTIPRPIRGAILNWFEDQRISKPDVWERFAQHEGYSRFDDLVARVTERYGEAVGQEVKDGMLNAYRADFEGVAGHLSSTAIRKPLGQQVLAENLPRYAFEHMPDADFATVLEHALRLLLEARYKAWLSPALGGGPDVDDAIEYLNGLFEKRAVPYRVTSDSCIEWHGDKALHDRVVAPVLGALTDSRIAGAKDEFEAALGHLRAGKLKDLEDAIEEAAKSVESAMKVLIDASIGLSRRDNMTAKPLFDVLKDGRVVPPYTEKLILAASGVRNKEGGHGAGAVPRQLPAELAVATVNAAAVAISYLAAKLP